MNELTELINLGAIQQMQGNFDAAKEYYTKATAINAQNETLLNNMGMLLYQQKQFNDARVNFEQVVQLNDKNATAWLNLGNTSVLLNELENALNAFRQSLNLRPDQYEAWEGLAKLYMLAEDMPSAERCWSKAIELNPADNDLLLGLAHTYLSLGKANEALSAAQYVLSIDQQNTRALQTAGLAHLLCKNYGLAIQFFRQYLGLAPADVSVRNHLATALLQTGDMEPGKAEYDMILKLDPDNAEVRVNAGILCLGFRYWMEALSHFDYLLTKDPDFDKAGLYKGIALANLGRVTEARRIFEILSARNNSEWAVNAQKQLDILNNLN